MGSASTHQLIQRILQTSLQNKSWGESFVLCFAKCNGRVRSLLCEIKRAHLVDDNEPGLPIKISVGTERSHLVPELKMKESDYKRSNESNVAVPEFSTFCILRGIIILNDPKTNTFRFRNYIGALSSSAYFNWQTWFIVINQMRTFNFTYKERTRPLHFAEQRRRIRPNFYSEERFGGFSGFAVE
ncbi:hypothetical protein CDAR_555611 [Caerostris darwini]|uniref:Uncharacterized protein n=1 Tax=Caerostris darwini TaxID=1538125 RepID=A0AAV4QT70_9ARAC|nr:hypothetical protein CDAR_555611 [Caerostris darwini]